MNIALDKSRCSHSTYLSIAGNFGNFKLFLFFLITTDTTLRRGVIMLDTNWLQKSKELVNLSQAKKPICVCTIFKPRHLKVFIILISNFLGEFITPCSLNS